APWSVRTVSLGDVLFHPSGPPWCHPFSVVQLTMIKPSSGASSAAASPPPSPVPEVWLSPVPESVVPPPASGVPPSGVPLVPVPGSVVPSVPVPVVPSPVSGPV
ncbi:DUF4190 domain-containing protein, partial [Dysosmobacter welbionis]